MQDFIKINREDMAAVALKPMKKGMTVTVDDTQITLLEDIPQGHKFALCHMKKGAPVIKYGATIGYAKEDIQKGSWIHVHNLKTSLGDVLEYKYEPVSLKELTGKKASFMGYRRADGTVGVRNELWILPTVGCVSSVAKAIEQEAKKIFPHGNVEEIVPLPILRMFPDGLRTRKTQEKFWQIWSIIQMPGEFLCWVLDARTAIFPF